MENIKKEFGYEVSKDWKKLLKIAREGKIKFLLFYWSSGLKTQDKFMLREVTELCADKLTDKEFFEKALRYNYAFIDPEPVNENAIYYSDGTVVGVGETISIGGKQGKDTLLFRGAVCILVYIGTDHEKHIPIAISNMIEWDGNRMTNVSKVVE